MRTCQLISAAMLIAALVISPGPAPAQEYAAPAGTKGSPSPARPATRPPGAATPSQPAAKPGEPAKPGEQPKPGEKKPGEKKDGDAEQKTVKRPDKPASPADPKELEIAPDEEGKVRVNFQGQPWQDVLIWLAKISNLSLDWQELPADYLNLRTQRSYTVPEVQDLVNQHLLVRGFTMLFNGEILSVVNLKKLDPSMVPTIDPTELASRMPHEFVQTVFPLDWLVAEKAVEEFKPFLSPNGKLTKLEATNRILAMDAVANLREIHQVLQEEQSGRGQERLVRTFRLQYTRAEEVRTLLEELLGIEKKSSAPMSPQQMQQMQQMMQQRAQQQQGKQQAQPEKEADASFIVNSRENAIIATAPPTKMAIIEQTVKMLDAPGGDEGSLLLNINRMQVHRLAQLKPEPLVKMLREMGNLDPRTRLDIDEKNNSIIAYASAVDQMTIKMVVEKLDGSGRKFKVIPLRRLPADYVAGTIRFMMGGEDEQNSSSQRRYPYYYYGYGGMNNQEEDQSKKFRVDADVENNRLLLYANEVELQEIQNLLVQLGEVRPSDGAEGTVRVLDVTDEQAEELLRRLQQAWPSVRGNPLMIGPPARRPERSQEEPGDPEQKPDPLEAPAKETRSAVRNADVPAIRVADTQPAKSHYLLAQLEADPTAAESEPESEPAERPSAQPSPELQERLRQLREPAASGSAPVHVSRGPDGRLIVTSEDPQALNALEDLAAELLPPRKDFRIYKLKHADVWEVWYNLTDFFGEEEEDQQSGYPFFYYYDRYGSQDSSSPTRLSSRKKLKFIYDTRTKTILVQGGDSRQHAIIDELIEFYDRPESQDMSGLRVTKIFYLKYSKAKEIAETLKDVYRDLLSENDKTFQQQNKNGQEKQPVAERSYTYIIGDSSKEGPEAPIKFKGLISIGIDEISNSVVVSTTAGLLREVGPLIEDLDVAARSTVPPSMNVVPSYGFPGGVQSRMQQILGPNIEFIVPTLGTQSGQKAGPRVTTSSTGTPRGSETKAADVVPDEPVEATTAVSGG